MCKVVEQILESVALIPNRLVVPLTLDEHGGRRGMTRIGDKVTRPVRWSWLRELGYA